jgi:predicted metal-dependent hydrolase
MTTAPATTGDDAPGDDELHPLIRPRRVRFDWQGTPMHWVPGDPFATHLANVLHLLLPAGERWFVHVYKQVLPYIRDERLRTEVKGFMGQEATHAVAHAQVLTHLREQGLDPTPYVADIEWMFERLLGDDTMPPSKRIFWLRERLAVIAAIEHFTAVLGRWVLDAQGYDRVGADPVMLDLLRWHGAEEVEHRSVAFDTFTHLDGGYARRVRSMAVTFPIMTWLWVRGVRFLMANDPRLADPPEAPARPRWSDLRRAARAGLSPAPRELLAAVPRYLRRGYHPSQEGSTSRARAYLAVSPAARAATESSSAASVADSVSGPAAGAASGTVAGTVAGSAAANAES